MQYSSSDKKTPLLTAAHLGENNLFGESAPSVAPIETVASVYEPSIAFSQQNARGEEGELSRKVHLISLLVNILLFGAKLWVYIQSQSMVVLAALIDSTVDLLAQGILLITNRMSSTREPSALVLYPAGRSRAEPVGVIACALLMAMASAQVIRDSSVELYKWWHEGTVFAVEIDTMDELLLAMTTLLKFILYLYCVWAAKRMSNVTVEAVAQDHLNDVLSNSAALIAAAATQIARPLWLCDPVGAVLISVYIIYSWAMTGMEQLDLVIGKVADADFLELVREMSETHDPMATLDQIRAYHFGPRFLVEIEIVMQPETPLRESHDVGIVLQHKIERLEQVERCFVHVDYQVHAVSPGFRLPAFSSRLSPPGFLFQSPKLAAVERAACAMPLCCMLRCMLRLDCHSSRATPLLSVCAHAHVAHVHVHVHVCTARSARLTTTTLTSRWHTRRPRRRTRVWRRQRVCLPRSAPRIAALVATPTVVATLHARRTAVPTRRAPRFRARTSQSASRLAVIRRLLRHRRVRRRVRAATSLSAVSSDAGAT